MKEESMSSFFSQQKNRGYKRLVELEYQKGHGGLHRVLLCNNPLVLLTQCLSVGNDQRRLPLTFSATEERVDDVDDQTYKELILI